MNMLTSRNIAILALSISLVLSAVFFILGSALGVYASLIVAGIIFLVKGADFLVEGGSAVAEHYGISHMIIGLTIVAFGTSMPEFMVSVYASFIGSGGISLGNIVGSNIFNILIVLGIPAAIAPIAVKKGSADFDLKFMIFVSIVMFCLSFNFLMDGTTDPYVIGLYDGIILLLLFGFYMKKIAKNMRTQNLEYIASGLQKHESVKKSAMMVIGGIAGIGIGGQLLVENGRALAIMFGVPEILIGLTLMAFGTSLPELAAGAVSALKGKHEMAIGNVIGSNIFNILLVGGAAAVVRPISGIAQGTMFVMMPFMIGISLLLYFVMKRGNTIPRKEGAAFVLIYAGFMAYLIISAI